MSGDATPTTAGGDTDARIAQLDARLAAYERSQAQVFSLVGPRTDLTERWGPRVRIGLIEEGRYMGEVLSETGASHGFPKLIGEPFPWLTSTLPPLSKWLDGTAYLEQDYPELFAVLGSTFNTYRGASAPAAGSFRVPDWEGLMVVGYDSGVPTFSSFANSGGSRDAIVVSHTHTDTFGVSPASHHHSLPTDMIRATSGTNQFTASAGTTYKISGANDSGDQALTISGSVQSEGVAGTGGNMPPYGVARWAIFAGR